MSKHPDINEQFNWEYFARLHAVDKQQAIKYQQSFTHKEKKEELDEKQAIINELSSYGVRAFRNWKMETLVNKLEEARKQQ